MLRIFGWILNQKKQFDICKIWIYRSVSSCSLRTWQNQQDLHLSNSDCMNRPRNSSPGYAKTRQSWCPTRTCVNLQFKTAERCRNSTKKSERRRNDRLLFNYSYHTDRSIIINLLMSFDALEEELVITGGLLSISLFEEKLMKNFMIIANKLRRLEAITDLESKTKVMEK